MPRIKRYNNDTGQWEYANTGTMPVKGIHYLTKEDYDQMKADIDSHFNGLMETLSVTVVGNQSTSSTDLIGATISVVQSDGTMIASGTWEGSELVFNINMGVEYYVRVDASGQGYNSFTSDTFTSEGGYSRSIEADVYAEKLTVNVSGLSSGFTITISGVGTQTSTSGSYLIPYGQSYTVSASDVNGYKTPSSVNYTASTISRNVTITYEESLTGIFIATSAGNLISPSSWTSSSGTAVGVAVITDNSSYIIGRVYTHKSSIAWSSNISTDLSDVPTSTSSSTIATYYDGVSYTDAMIAAGSEYNTTDYAAGYVRSKSITFGSSTLTGYLGSAGEWQDALNNHETIMDAFAAIGDTFASNLNNFWASCEYSSDSAWTALWYEDGSGWSLELINKSVSAFAYFCAVPFYKIDL